MAALIRLNTKPSKYLLRNKLMVVQKNHLQKSADLARNNRAIIYLDASIKAAREAIEDFLQQKDSLRDDFINRSLRKHKIKLATEVFMLVIDFLKNLHNEAKAVNTIAYKIASNIATSPTLINQTYDDVLNIEAELLKAVSLKIFVPENKMPTVSYKFQGLSVLFGPSGLFTSTVVDNNAKLELCSDDFSFNLFFNDADLDETLKNVCKLSDINFS